MTTYLSSNPHETLVAGFLIGIFATLFITGLCRLLRDLWSEYVARAAEATVTETPEARRRRLFDAECDRALAVAEVQVSADARLRSVGDVPFQRRAGVDS